MVKREIIDRIIQSKLFACCAFLHFGRGGKCLKLESAIDVIKMSKTGGLIYHIHRAERFDEKNLFFFGWSFDELISQIGDVSSYAILGNTSLATDFNEAIESARLNFEYYDAISSYFPHQNEPIIKLEILDRDLKSVDSEVIRAAKFILEEQKLTVIPLISPNSDNIKKCIDLGIPMIRLLSGKIGSLSGIDNPPLIKNLINKINIPVILEGGIASAAHVREALSIGAAGVLINTAFHKASNPGMLAAEIRTAIDNFRRN
jgi:thiazole synthase ThiGH ThiG subunit